MRLFFQLWCHPNLRGICFWLELGGPRDTAGRGLRGSRSAGGGGVFQWALLSWNLWLALEGFCLVDMGGRRRETGSSEPLPARVGFALPFLVSGSFQPGSLHTTFHQGNTRTGSALRFPSRAGGRASGARFLPGQKHAPSLP